MENKSVSRIYWREILLVLIGGLLASIPTLISTKMQVSAQLRHLILDRQIIALRDYSVSYQKLATDVLTTLEKFEMMIDDFESEYKAKKNYSKLNSDNWRQLQTDFQVYLNKYRAWCAEVNTQIIVVNILFNTNLAQSQFTDYGIDDPMTVSDKNYTIEQRITFIKNRISNLKKGHIKMTENHQALMDTLRKYVTQH